MGPNTKSIAAFLANALIIVIFEPMREFFPDIKFIASATYQGAWHLIVSTGIVYLFPNTKTDPATGESVNTNHLPVPPGISKDPTMRTIVAALMIGLGALSLSACGTLLPQPAGTTAQNVSPEQQARLRVTQTADIVADAQNELTFLLQVKAITVTQAEKMQALTARADDLVTRANVALQQGQVPTAVDSLDAAQVIIRQLMIERANARTSAQ